MIVGGFHSQWVPVARIKSGSGVWRVVEGWETEWWKPSILIRFQEESQTPGESTVVKLRYWKRYWTIQHKQWYRAKQKSIAHGPSSQAHRILGYTSSPRWWLLFMFHTWWGVTVPSVRTQCQGTRVEACFISIGTLTIYFCTLFCTEKVR